MTMAISTKCRATLLTGMLLLVAAVWLVETTAAREGSSKGSSMREPSVPRTSKNGRLSSRKSGTAESNQQNERRLREGTLVTDQSGFFREDGEGATFVADTGFEFGSLPNLNLERVVRLLKSAEEPSSIRWSVTGQVTEFSGRNFLLISRAVYKSAAPPPLPDRVAR